MNCPNCGCEKTIETTLKDLKLKPVDNLYCSGSPVSLHMCCNCGTIISIVATKPELISNFVKK